MVRKLVKTLLSLSLMTPVAALALGLGDVQLHSALNQRLNADIKLLSVNPDEADTISVSLASYDDFAKVGLDRPGYLMFLRFNLEKTSGGGYYIKLSSSDVMREPFLDFLVEVKWRSGRVLREYTLLLDPPVSHRQPAPVITSPETTTTAPGMKAGAPAKTEEAFVPPPSSIPVAPGVKSPDMAKGEEGAKTTPQKTVQAKPAATAPVRARPAATQGGIVYGPVKANDTLWKIALKVRPGGDITVQQMMLALLKANPYAFYGNNINRLKKGFVLRVDDRTLLTAMSKAEAAREVSRQTRQWQDYRAARAKKAKARKQVASAKTPTGAVATAKKEPKLELVSPGGKSESTGQASGDGKSAQKDLMLALESSAAQRKENEQLQKRIKGLEDQLKDMQRLLTLKDADLAALQKQLREQGQAVSLPSGKTGQEEAQPMAESAKPATTETPASGEEMPATEAMTTEQPAAEDKPVAETMPAEKPVAETEAKKPEPVAKPEPKKPVKPAPVPVTEEPSVVDLLMENLNTLLMAGGGILILALLGIWLKRRRSGGFQESILSGATSSMLNAKEDELEGETSFLSDLAISGMGGGTIQSDEGEVDPLTEADVFMAYGRNQQAEEVLKKALEKNPERQDINAKLLEVYYNLKDSDKFLALVTGSAAGLKDNSELWGKVAAMGHELAPENDLFGEVAGAEASAPALSGTPEPAAEDVLDIGLDLNELSTEMEGEAASDEDLAIDLGLDFGDLEEEAQPAAAEEPAQVEETMDFDLELGGLEEAGEAPEAENEIGFDLDLGTESSAEQSTDLDFDLGALGTEEAEPAEEFALDLGTEGEEEVSMDFDLGAAEEQASTAEDELDLGELGDIDFGDLGLETTEEEEQPVALESDELDLSGLESTSEDLGDFGDFSDLDEEGLLGDSDEIATKLDLAQAYIEMGDNEGARTMLEEVVEGGNDEQKQQAQELLSKV